VEYVNRERKECISIILGFRDLNNGEQGANGENRKKVNNIKN